MWRARCRRLQRALTSKLSDASGASAVRPATTLADYRTRYLSHPRFADGRKTVYITPELHRELSLLYRNLAPGRQSTFSGFVECVLREHLETYGQSAQKWVQWEK